MQLQSFTTILLAFGIGNAMASPVPNLAAREVEAAAIAKIHAAAVEAHNAVILKARDAAAAAGQNFQLYYPYAGGHTANGVETTDSEQTVKLLGILPLFTTDTTSVTGYQENGAYGGIRKRAVSPGA